MVNLPTFSARNRREGYERERASDSRSHRTWGMRLGRSRGEMKHRGEPTGLQELEELARRSVKLMKKHGTITKESYFEAMNLLRQQYNLNFIILCKHCNGPHSNDELLAPERSAMGISAVLSVFNPENKEKTLQERVHDGIITDKYHGLTQLMPSSQDSSPRARSKVQSRTPKIAP